VTPLASDGRIALRRYVPEDIDALYAAVDESRAVIGRWMPWCHAAYGREDAAHWVNTREQAWAEGNELSMLIVDAASGSLLGSSGLNQFNRINGFANLGYWVRASAQRQGVASAAARLVASYAFGSVGLDRVEILAAVDNVASQRTAERVGAHFEGICRNRLKQFGGVADAALYALIPADLA
jgi:RimJ/RimL family protein N-acetyltransferase